MLQAMIITLREGVEAALVVGITLVYLDKIGRAELRKVVYWALGAAFFGSIGIAVALSRAAIAAEAFEGWVMLGAAFFVITMVVWMMRTARKLKSAIESRVGRLAGKSSAIGLFLFVFLMVLREGAETVLVLSAVEMNSTQLLGFIGTLIGIGLAVLFGVMFVKGSVRINLPRFFQVTTTILVFVALQLIVSGLHELSEFGVLPASKREMAIIGPIVSNDVFFFITILALAALMVLFDSRRRAPATAESASKAELRKAQWTARRERLWTASVYASAFVFILLVTAQFIYAKSTSSLSQAVMVEFTDGHVRIPTGDLKQGDLHRYFARVNGVATRFFLYRRPDNSVAALVDACEICGGAGFYATHDGVICKNCTAPINPMTVGIAGGCNPIPLKADIKDDAVTIAESDLAPHTVHFKD